MEKIERKSVVYQYYHGLPKSIKNANVISLVIKKCDFEGPKYLNKHVTFDKLDDGNYDFPVYHPSTPEGFSIFMTKNEKVYRNIK